MSVAKSLRTRVVLSPRYPDPALRSAKVPAMNPTGCLVPGRECRAPRDLPYISEEEDTSVILLETSLPSRIDVGRSEGGEISGVPTFTMEEV